jgi:DNA-binding MarR family transcriptional regulator
MLEPSPEGFDDLLIETFRLNGRLIAAGDGLGADLGLTSARWQVLGAASLSPVPLTVAQIARNIGLSRQAVLRVAKEMARDGLIAFEPNPHHRRARLVVLTDRGRAAYRAVMGRQRPWAARLSAGLPARRIKEALEVLRTVRTRLEANNAVKEDDDADD